MTSQITMSNESIQKGCKISFVPIKHTLPSIHRASEFSTAKVVSLRHEGGPEGLSCQQRALQFPHLSLIEAIPTDSRRQVSAQLVPSFREQTAPSQILTQPAIQENNQLNN